MLVKHLFLVKAKDYKAACQRIKNFLERYQLVSYEEIEFYPEEITPKNPLFGKLLQEGISGNKRFIENSLKKLDEEGYKNVLDLKNLPQGYLSKELHTVVHFLDGFFGIDSIFYNLEEDSHWVSRKLYQEISENPECFWLVKVKGISLTDEPLFEKLKETN